MELLPMRVWVHMAVTMVLIGIPFVLKVSPQLPLFCS